MKVNLVTFSRKGARKDFVLADRPMVIGRKPEADVRIPVNEVSRSHCEILLRGKSAYIRDLGSSNGTFVNELKVEECALKAGDRVRVGPVIFTVQIDGSPAKISPAGASPVSRPTAPPEAKTQMIPPAEEGSGDFNVDSLEELGSPDLSDFDIEEVTEESGLIEEISEADLIPDDEDEKKK